MKVPLVTTTKPVLFEGRRTAISRNILFLKKLIGFMQNEGEGWMQRYLKIEGLANAEEEDEDFGPGLREEGGNDVDELDQLKILELAIHEDCSLDCPVKAKTVMQKKQKD
ncbi:hypothetical protein SUGI_0994720 [Cryptomeria japonica]|nr:hypothetical protein SUGI_0994720 [Cryptomeria japonica]